MPVTTRTGDTGFASTGDGRFRKDAPVFAVLGDLDELNCLVGTLPGSGFLRLVQETLMSLSADIAGCSRFDAPAAVAAVEAEMAAIGEPEKFQLSPPCGPTHLARAVCRRAERSLVAFSPNHPGISYLNRLADCLYLLAVSEVKQ